MLFCNAQQSPHFFCKMSYHVIPTDNEGLSEAMYGSESLRPLMNFSNRSHVAEVLFLDMEYPLARRSLPT